MSGPASASDLDAWRAEAGEAAGWAAYGIRDGVPFGHAARTGWPRDAARVAVLAAEVARLAALESVAINHHDTCLGACGCGVCAWVKASRKEEATQ